MTLNRNPTNFFAESESIQFAPSNVVNGVTFVPDPLLAWRLMSYDDTASHRHGSPNSIQLPVNRPIANVFNNFRDGPMQGEIFSGESISSPDGIGGVVGASPQKTLQYGNEQVNGKIGRYGTFNDPFTQARIFWYSLSNYSQQHLVDGYRFELGNVADPAVTAKYVSSILNEIDNCLARRVAYGIGAPMPAKGSGSTAVPKKKYPSQYPLDSTAALPLDGLSIAILADESMLSTADFNTFNQAFTGKLVSVSVIAPHAGSLATGVVANQSYITTSSIFYDAIIIGGINGSGKSFNSTQLPFIEEAYSHGKPVGSIGTAILDNLNYTSQPGVFTSNSAMNVAQKVLAAMASPRRYPQRQPLDNIAEICG